MITPSDNQGMEEIFDVCDTEDRVIAQAPRSQVHARKLLHRAVHVFVRNSRGELWGQVRSATKDEFPLCYTSSASGHLGAGEDYQTAAVREMQEEIGLTGKLKLLTKLAATPELAYEHTVLYEVRSDASLQPDPGEISGMVCYSLEEWLGRLVTEPEKFSPPFRVLLEWYARRPPGERTGN